MCGAPTPSLCSRWLGHPPGLQRRLLCLPAAPQVQYLLLPVPQLPLQGARRQPQVGVEVQAGRVQAPGCPGCVCSQVSKAPGDTAAPQPSLRTSRGLRAQGVPGWLGGTGSGHLGPAPHFPQTPHPILRRGCKASEHVDPPSPASLGTNGVLTGAQLPRTEPPGDCTPEAPPSSHLRPAPWPLPPRSDCPAAPASTPMGLTEATKDWGRGSWARTAVPTGAACRAPCLGATTTLLPHHGGQPAHLSVADRSAARGARSAVTCLHRRRKSRGCSPRCRRGRWERKGPGGEEPCDPSLSHHLLLQWPPADPRPLLHLSSTVGGTSAASAPPQLTRLCSSPGRRAALPLGPGPGSTLTP